MSTLLQNRIAPAVISGVSRSLEDTLSRQRTAIAHGKFMVAGRVMEIKFDRDGDNRQFAPGTSDIMKLTLQWDQKSYPVLAFHRDLGMLLPLGLPALPDIPDPSWKRPTKKNEYGELAADPDAQPPMISQNYFEHASGRFKVRGASRTTEYLVFQPIIQIAYVAAAPVPGKASAFRLVTGRKNDRDDRFPMLLYNPTTHHAYFMGGRWENG
jgi:hypothetical protein